MPPRKPAAKMPPRPTRGVRKYSRVPDRYTDGGYPEEYKEYKAALARGDKRYASYLVSGGAEEGSRVKTDEELLAGIKNGTHLSAQDFPALRYAIPGLLPEGYLVLAGAPFTGKTVLMLRIGLESARGGKVFGIRCEKRHVYCLFLEISEPRLQDACFELLGDDDIPEWFDYETEVPKGELIPRITAYLNRYPDALILIDTLNKVMEPPKPRESAYDRDERIGSQLKALDKTYPGCVIIASRHTKKGEAEDWVELVSGTQAITGACDTVFILSRKRGGTEGLLRVSSRLMDEAEYAILLNRPDGWQLDGKNLRDAADAVEERADDKKSDLTKDIIKLARELGEEGITRKIVAEKFGISENHAGVYLARCADRMDLFRIGRGRYTHQPLSKQVLLTLCVISTRENGHNNK